MRARPIGISLAVMLITIAAGLAVRFAPLGLPPFIVKYGGSTLWAVMIYWLLSTLLPFRRIIPITLGAGALATGVEFLKLYRSPPLDAFRHTLPGIILLGRYFSVWDILAYWLAIFVAALLDAQILRAHKPQASS